MSVTFKRAKNPVKTMAKQYGEGSCFDATLHHKGQPILEFDFCTLRDSHAYFPPMGDNYGLREHDPVTALGSVVFGASMFLRSGGDEEKFVAEMNRKCAGPPVHLEDFGRRESIARAIDNGERYYKALSPILGNEIFHNL